MSKGQSAILLALTSLNRSVLLSLMSAFTHTSALASQHGEASRVCSRSQRR
jgi:hypothetical protein